MRTVIGDLRMCEAQGGKPAGCVCLITQPVPRLLRWSAVIPQAVSLDDESQIGPEEVDLETIQALARERLSEARAAGDWQKEPLELRVGEPERMSIEDRAQLAYAPATGEAVQVAS